VAPDDAGEEAGAALGLCELLERGGPRDAQRDHIGRRIRPTGPAGA
jgi:hypothetical protein